MDSRRLSTADVLACGIIGLPIPQTDVPEDRAQFSAMDPDSFGCVEAEQIIAALEQGKVVSASNYYGIPYVWRESEGVYRGTLLQYRQVTEREVFRSASSAAAWFRDMFHATDG